MRQLGFCPLTKKKRGYKKSTQTHVNDMVQRNFTKHGCIVGDITQMNFGRNKKMFAAATLGLDTNQVSMSVSKHPDTALVTESLLQHEKGKGMIFHSDRGHIPTVRTNTQNVGFIPVYGFYRSVLG